MMSSILGGGSAGLGAHVGFVSAWFPMPFLNIINSLTDDKLKREGETLAGPNNSSKIITS